MEFVIGKTYITQCDGNDDSNTHDFFSKGERGVFQSHTLGDNAYFRREGTSSGGRENELLISKLRFDAVFGYNKPKTFEVEEDFIKAAHKAACSEWKTKIEAKFPDAFPKEVTYKIGDRFKKINSDPDEYILANVDGKRVTLINLNNGNRWLDPVELRIFDTITPDEWKLITDNQEYKFELIK